MTLHLLESNFMLHGCDGGLLQLIHKISTLPPLTSVKQTNQIYGNEQNHRKCKRIINKINTQIPLIPIDRKKNVYLEVI